MPDLHFSYSVKWRKPNYLIFSYYLTCVWFLFLSHYPFADLSTVCKNSLNNRVYLKLFHPYINIKQLQIQMLTDLHRFGFVLRRLDICRSFLLLFLLWRIIRFVSRRSGWAFGDRFRRFCFRLQLELINLYLSKDHHIRFLIIVRADKVRKTWKQQQQKNKNNKKKQQQQQQHSKRTLLLLHVKPPRISWAFSIKRLLWQAD